MTLTKMTYSILFSKEFLHLIQLKKLLHTGKNGLLQNINGATISSDLLERLELLVRDHKKSSNEGADTIIQWFKL
jgi:hypothetical protein